MLAKILLLLVIDFNPSHVANFFVTEPNAFFISCPTTIKNIRIQTTRKHSPNGTNLVNITSDLEYDPKFDIEMFSDKLFLLTNVFYNDTTYYIRVSDQIKTYYFIVTKDRKVISYKNPTIK